MSINSYVKEKNVLPIKKKMKQIKSQKACGNQSTNIIAPTAKLNEWKHINDNLIFVFSFFSPFEELMCEHRAGTFEVDESE